MKNRFTLFFAALMMTLGVCADDVVYNGRHYFDWPTTVVQKNEVTSEDQLATLDGKYIVIQHNHTAAGLTTPGSYLSMNSLILDGNSYHTTFLSEECVGLSMFKLEKVEEEGVLKGYKLKTIHHKEDSNPCYLGKFGSTNLNTTNLENGEAALINFKYVEGKGFFITSKADKTDYWGTVTRSGYFYLSAENSAISASNETDANLTLPSNFDNIAAFNVYEVPENGTQGVTKFVENASVKLIGPSGNIVTTTHSGWSDFYEFTEHSSSSSVNYGVSISNVLYHPATNQITANIKYAFPVSGDVAKIPVHLCPTGNPDLRISIVGGNLKVVQKPAEGWTKDKNNQWYIFPKFENNDFTYAIKNVGTQQYINFAEGSRDITLSETPSYFTLYSDRTGNYLQLGFKYSSSYTYCLYGNSDEYVNPWNSNNNIPAWKVHTLDKDNSNAGIKFLVPAVSAAELDGKPAIGFTRYFHEDTYFWDGGHVEYENLPEGVKGIFNNYRHEGILENGSVHNVYTAMTGMEVTQTGSVVVQFDYINGKNSLLVLGVDVTTLDGTKVVSWDYHFGKVGTPSEDNIYILNNIEQGKYLLRYWVCNRTDLDGWEGHNLKNVRGKIQVKGANYNLLKSEAPSADAFHANTTWFRMRLCDGLEKYISAQPAYTDWHNKLKLSNNTPPTDYAGLWCVVGDEENGYKIYNRAWGPEYAMKTEGENGDARTYMVPVAEASTYDIVQEEDSYKYYVKVHGVTDKFLNDRGGYLATWNNSSALGDGGSVMTFETVNEEVFEANTVTVENELKKLWAPWTGDGANPDINTAFANNLGFASWVLGRQQLADLLDGKVFKFVNKATDDSNRGGRALGVIEVNSEKFMGGIVPKNDGKKYIDEYLQLLNNNDGTYKLLHIGTNKYFQNPNVATITENVADAANYTYEVYQDEVQTVHFVSGNEHMHLGNWGYEFKTISWGGADSEPSRWDVVYDEEAQDLAELIKTVKARYAEVNETAYQANVGVPGYADATSTEGLMGAVNGLFGKTFDEATITLTNAMDVVTDAERTAVYPTDCYFTITNCGTTNEPRNISVIYDANKAEMKDQNDGISEFLWHNTSALDKNNPDHLWCFYHNEKNDQYYLYNVGKKQFASPTGKGSYGLTWIFSDTPVAITMTDLDAETPTFHIQGQGKEIMETMSVSTGYEGSVITWYSNGDAGVPFKFEKSELEFDETAFAAVSPKLAPGFYTLKCGNAYLSDDRYTDDTTRSMTEGTPGIKNIFYNTEDNALVGFASGFGFVYATCNTGKPEDGYNTFKFGYGDNAGTFTVMSQRGTTDQSQAAWNDGRYFKKDGGKLLYTNNLKEADSWTIEAVTELPVTLNYAGEGLGAYGTLWSPVALNIPDGIQAFYGSVSKDNALVLTEVEGGVIPAEAGVVLWDKSATTTYVKNLEINAEATVEAPETNKFEGWVFTRVNENKGYYYSLGKMNEHMAFYKYTGANLSGFRARIARQNAQGIQSLSFRFANPTSIEEVIAGFQNNAVYDLNGRRVTTPEKGIYIVNGKKVIIK